MVATDAEIIRMVLEGQQDRYAELVGRYQAAAIKVAYGFVGNYEDARELSQNGFVKAYQHLARFRGQSKFSTWLYRIVVNECKDFLKRKGRRPPIVSLFEESDADEPGSVEVVDASGGPSEALVNRELARHLSEAIDQLPMKQRMAFILHHVQGLPLEEMTEIMDCRVGTVKAHLFRATERLRVLLSPYVKTTEVPKS